MKNNYRTEQRKIIEDYLKEQEEKFVSAEEIMNYVQKKKIEVGLTTIYRYLKLLETKGIVRTETKEHTKFYQYIDEDCKNHFHLKCKSCGKTFHLDCQEMKQVNKHIEDEHKFTIDFNNVIYGICDKCK